MLTVSQTSPYLNRTVLQRTLEHLPKLRGLHIIGCLRVTHVDVLSVTEHTPLLQSLAFTVMETVSTLFFPIVNRSIVGVLWLLKRPRIPSLVTHAVLHPRLREAGPIVALTCEHLRWGRISTGLPVSPDPTRARSTLTLFMPSDRILLQICHGPL
jgi:hypothetical protein